MEQEIAAKVSVVCIEPIHFNGEKYAPGSKVTGLTMRQADELVAGKHAELVKEELKADQAAAEQATADQLKADQAAAEQATADQLKADQAAAEQLKADQEVADTSATAKTAKKR